MCYTSIKSIVEDIIPNQKHPIKLLPDLPGEVKKLERRVNRFAADKFNGYITLLDKIVDLAKEQTA